MRIATVSHYYPPHVGGIEVVAEACARSAAARGDVVTVVSSASRDAPASSVDGEVRVVRARSWNVLERRFGIPFPLFGPGFVRACAAAVRQADLVHVHDVFYLSSHIAGILALILRRPMLITQHVGIVDHPSRVVRIIQHLVYATMGRLLLARAKAVIVYNINVRNTIRPFVGDTPVIEIRNGIDVTRFAPVDARERLALRGRHDLPANRPIVLFVGRLVPKKGYDLLLQAVGPEFLTVFAGARNGGEGDSEAGCSRSENALFLGEVDRDRLIDYYRLADLVVLPAKGEIFTLTAQEAMACGTPVVLAEDPGYDAYDFDRHSIVLAERSVGGLREAILSLLDAPEELAAAREYVREFAVERFSWQANVAEHLTILDAARGGPDPADARLGRRTRSR